MKKRRGWIVLLIVLLLLGGLVIWQFDNLQAVWLYMTLDEETVSQQVEDVRDRHHQSLEQDHAITVKPPSLSQSEDLLDGKVSPEEVKQSLGISSDQTSSVQKTAEDLVNECVAELYALKVDVMGKLGGMKQELLDQWKALPPKERTREKKLELGYAGLDACYDYGVAVDGQVKAILDKYRPLLEEINADTGVLDTLWEYYCEEKASEKAYYLNKYL